MGSIGVFLEFSVGGTALHSGGSWVMQAGESVLSLHYMEGVIFVFWDCCPAVRGQGMQGYARHVCLCLHCVWGLVEQAFMSFTLGPLWLKD